MALWHFEYQLADPRDVVMIDGLPRGYLANLGDAATLRTELSKYFRETVGWSPAIVVFGDWDGSNVSLITDLNGAVEVSVRASMYDASSDFLHRVFDIARRCDLRIYVDDRGTVEELADLLELARSSRAAAFCRDPQKFLDSRIRRREMGD